jgi:hypothetical protein
MGSVLLEPTKLVRASVTTGLSLFAEAMDKPKQLVRV